MKKRLLLLMTCLMLGLFGCREDDTRESEEAELDAVSSSMDGTLTEYTGSQLSIETEDGGTLTFKDCSSAKIQCKNGIIPGNEVTLVYVGGIDGTDTSNVKVRKIITSDDNSSVMSLAEHAKEDIALSGGMVTPQEDDSQAGQDMPASGAQVEETHQTASVISGVNVRADALSGSEILGTLGGGDSVTVTGICDNGWYRIIFENQTGFVWRDYLSL
ncbi:MAG TPA: SH3 domain-containing protein [Candidatus Blautia pullicola]|uniref:SH3 domain-containing protein n=1 Tax=Candidatus Blautia pullicola TaxID=2838498 RepID=A0A9D2FQ61_9FIRM|nr:SH3 domain-containing protein [Candidatus Blautia pullicola]